ncbi:MAG: hypothetical protein H6739_21510 [Alphaproteobacteria bacterium]|nr:hypothetical protein [Alphaproteobacteria bacterium]
MRYVLLAAPLALLAGCTGSDKDADDSAAADDSAIQFHPNVPDGYEYRWDTDGCGEANDQTQVYKLATANSTEAGRLTVTETWYWFFGGDWEDDCIDVIEYTANAVPNSTLEALGAGEAEEGYQGMMTKVDEGCPQMNYLYLWDHPDKDDFEYGDPLEQEVIVIFDNLSPSGNLNYENAMLIFMGYNVGNNRYTMSYDYATGVFNPQTEILGPPADYTWEASICLGEGGA